jgi:hypothetical protein
MESKNKKTINNTKADRVANLARLIVQVRGWRADGSATRWEVADVLRYLARHRGDDFVEALALAGPADLK